MDDQMIHGPAEAAQGSGTSGRSGESSESDESVSSGESAGGVPWWQAGQEPDYRATMANERTFLAWMRTALALMAAALATLQLAHSMPTALRIAIAAYLLVLGAAVAAAGYVRWRDIQHRMRLGRPLGRGVIHAYITAALLLLVLLAALAAIYS